MHQIIIFNSSPGKIELQYEDACDSVLSH